ncbi:MULTISPECIES: hypothetical protein [unclassified Mesorhizobium]|uniref:hypothetical protein n=1 Tax=unclassified Mesorhizobium TaxID=325217 RepID=UPI001CCA3F55|nr:MULTISPECIES: hypothetical protein [unclassified Mesorhizobium]MBZ9734549.1 hypothetical protein [Mesorhizobium sp. CA9]MBZ9812126.1 hypothetical protein [Mesorhizobium sp. CA7]MBZ9826915.1 hypothetical protein [Mesorhizobium sp. CA18]MBZ9832463.1 hypothetical protein [Mesorhizobium sp. CA2]MBZ9838481.1 hypothetical protein [Mesorhizobium sp. CA3]
MLDGLQHGRAASFGDLRRQVGAEPDSHFDLEPGEVAFAKFDRFAIADKHSGGDRRSHRDTIGRHGHLGDGHALSELLQHRALNGHRIAARQVDQTRPRYASTRVSVSLGDGLGNRIYVSRHQRLFPRGGICPRRGLPR